MILIAISIAFFLAIAGSIVLVGYLYYVRPGRLIQQLDPDVPSPRLQTLGMAPKKEAEDAPIVKMIKGIGEKVPASPNEVGDLRKRLLMAGYRSEAAVPVFRGFQIVGAAIGLVGGLTLRIGLENTNLLLPFLLAALGWVVPSFALSKLVARRHDRLRLSLPDALDLLVICVEAGMGLDQAIQKVSQELSLAHKEICDELKLVVLEARAGKRRIDALRNVADRTGQADIGKLVQVLAQSDRFGTSMSDALHAHSDFMRVKRRQDAQERAGKVGVKLIFPIFFFILPAILAISAGPAMIRVLKVLVPMMQGIGN
jgi:tight adherence protein C